MVDKKNILEVDSIYMVFGAISTKNWMQGVRQINQWRQKR